jgi:lipopolysaccharide export LptBFGC system permease protein LptF
VRRKQIALGVTIVLVLAFAFFVPFIQVPAYSGKSAGPPMFVWVSISHHAFGVGGWLWQNELRPTNPYNYAIDW